MAYNENIPQSTDQLSQSQSDILANFQAIKALVDVNHVDFASADQGKHKFVTFPVQAPAPTFGATEVGLYNFLNPTTVKNELYVNKISGAGSVQIPATASILSTNAAPVIPAGWTYLPSGIYLVWGQGNANGLTTVTISSPSSPPPNAIIGVIVTITNTSTVYVDQSIRLVDIVSNSQFRVFGSRNGAAGVCGFSFLAIGY